VNRLAYIARALKGGFDERSFSWTFWLLVVLSLGRSSKMFTVIYLIAGKLPLPQIHTI